MASPFLGEIRSFGFNFAPRGWATCDGQILSIAANTALYSLLGTMYGGNGTSTFGLPELRGRAPVSFGQYYTQGELDGTENVTLTTASMPSHNHAFMGNTGAGNSPAPLNTVLAKVGGNQTPNHYTDPYVSTIALNAMSVGQAGGNQPHNNMQPYLVINYCIALSGVYPSRN